MTARYDWSEVEESFGLGGYAVNAVLSNSTALLALMALTTMRPKYRWCGYDDFDDIETAIDTAISQIMNGSSPVGGNMIKIAESSINSDTGAIYVDGFDSGDWVAFELIIQGMLSNYASNYPDHVEVEFNNVQSNSAYSSYGRFFYNGSPVNYENILNYPANIMYWGAAAAQASDNIWGHAKLTIYNPLVTGHKTFVYTSTQAGFTANKLHYTSGSCGVFVAQPITKILIRPYYGTSWLAGGSLEPDKLTMTLYGLS